MDLRIHAAGMQGQRLRPADELAVVHGLDSENEYLSGTTRAAVAGSEAAHSALEAVRRCGQPDSYIRLKWGIGLAVGGVGTTQTTGSTYRTPFNIPHWPISGWIFDPLRRACLLEAAPDCECRYSTRFLDAMHTEPMLSSSNIFWYSNPWILETEGSLPIAAAPPT